MNIERARKILNSSDIIEVSYQGVPVWIESIQHDDSAEITNLETRKRMKAPIQDLKETNTLL